MARKLRNTKGQFISGVKQLIDNLDKRYKKSVRENNQVLTLGYQAAYAIHVHENLQARHAPGKQAKYLSDPAKRFRGQMRNIVRNAVRAGLPVNQAQLLALLLLQRESQKIVPVSGWDPVISPPRQGSGNLKGSVFIDVDKKK